MVDQALLFLERFGYQSIGWFWIPMLLWTICVALIYPVLRILYIRLHPNYHYHARLALLYALPVGLLLFLIPFQEFISEGNAPLLEQAIERTLHFQSTSMVEASQTRGTWYNVFCTLMGLISLTVLASGIFALFRLIRSFADLRLLTRSNLAASSQYAMVSHKMQTMARSIGIKRRPKLLITRYIHVPMTFGFINPVVIIPEHIANDSERLVPVLLHELYHVLRADYILAWFEQILLSLGQVNPLVRRLCDEIDDYREQSCDAFVLSHSMVTKSAYASILFEISQKQHIPSYKVDLRLARDNQSQLRRRIQSIKNMSLRHLYSNQRFLLSKGLSVFLLSAVSITLAGAYHVNFNEEFNPSFRSSKFEEYDVMPRFEGFGEHVSQAHHYPDGALLTGHQGLVMLDLRINRLGQVMRIRISQDPGSGLGNFARKQLERAQFTPAMHNGEMVDATIQFPVTFEIENGQANIHYGVRQTATPVKEAQRTKSLLQGATETPLTAPNPIELLSGYDLEINNQHSVNLPGAGTKAVLSDTPDVFLLVEEEPELIGGLANLQRHVRYPEIARKLRIEGRVFIQFVVDENGDVIDPVVTRGIGGGCDEAALEAVKTAKFKPGRQRGRPVRVQYSLPVSFRLAN